MDTCATDGCERDTLLKWRGYCVTCEIAWIQLDTCGARSEYAPENPPKCRVCLARPARIGFDRCMTCSECWLCTYGTTPLSGKAICREHWERFLERQREYMRNPENRERARMYHRERRATEKWVRYAQLAAKKSRRCMADGCDAIIPVEARASQLYHTRACCDRQLYIASQPSAPHGLLERMRARRLAGKKPRPCLAEDCDAIIPRKADARQIYCTPACSQRQRYAAKKLAQAATA